MNFFDNLVLKIKPQMSNLKDIITIDLCELDVKKTNLVELLRL